MAGEYRPGLPPPILAHEMWSREVCDRLDKVIKLLEGQNKLLSGTQTVSVSGPVELSEPRVARAASAPVKPAAAAARASSTAKK
jgi:hypothetical protein